MFEEIKKKLGFGCMRLPMQGDKIDNAELCRMVDYFIESGFNYFDTAHGYHSGLSEIALKECLTSRRRRDEYILADKLSDSFFQTGEDIRPFFEKQLQITGTDYFDFYLLHSQNSSNYEKYLKCRAYETAFELKKEGKVRHVGFSFHDRPALLERILADFPEVEFVQLQFNYLDYEDEGVASRKLYEICRAHGKPIIVMEPVKGGALARIPEEAQKIFASLGGGSAASYAIRYAAGFEGVFMVLSGMSNMAQMADNVSFMRDFKPLDQKEHAAVEEVAAILRGIKSIPCTACKYCVDGCPKRISIPELFADMNAKSRHGDWNSDYYYSVHTMGRGKASDCIGCGKCEKICPQGLEIRRLLKQVAAQFEK